MPIGLFKWGASSSGASPHYENELLIGYSLFDWITDRPPREGSVFVQAPSGAEDAWVTGRDYVMDAEVRFIPDKPSTTPERAVVAGPLSVQAFLDYCRDKNPFRFVPNVNTPDFYVEQCYLVEPIRGFGGNLADLTRGVRLVMRTTSMDFTQAMRGVAFEYKPGIALAEVSTGATFSRASVGSFIRSPSTGSQGQLVASEVSGVVRDRYRSSSSERGTLLEHASTNIVKHSEHLGASTYWVLSGATITSNDRRTPDATGSTTADKLIASTSVGLHTVRTPVQTVMTTGQTVALQVALRAAELAYADLLGDDNLANQFLATVDLAAGTVTGSVVGSGVIDGAATIRRLDDQWVAVGISGHFASTSTGFFLQARARVSTGNSFAGATSGQGLHVWALQAELATTDGKSFNPTSYIPTSSASAARSPDRLEFDWPWKPQRGWAYVKLQEKGTRDIEGAEILQIGSADLAPTILLRRPAGSTQYQAYHAPVSGDAVGSNINSTHAINDILEFLHLLSTDGAVQLLRSVNGGAETAGTLSTAPANPLASSWADAKIAFNAAVTGINPGAMVLIHAKAGFSTDVTTIAAARSA